MHNPMIENNPLFELLSTVDQGEGLKEALDIFKRVVEAGYKHGGKGEVNIKIHLSTKLGRNRKTVVAVNATGKEPKPSPGVSTFFPNERGELLREDPQQMRLNLDDEVVVDFKSRRGAADEDEDGDEGPTTVISDDDGPSSKRKRRG